MASAILISSEDIEPRVPVIEIMETLPSHIRAIKLRHEDEEECLSFGISPMRALWASYRYGIFRKTYFVNGEIAAVSGCSGDLLGNEAQPYLLTSEAVMNISPLKLARIYQKEVYNFLSVFPILSNWVDSRYSSAVRLLEIIGFTIGAAKPYGNGVFRQFRMEKC